MVNTSNTGLPRSTYQINELQANIVIAKLYCIVYTMYACVLVYCYRWQWTRVLFTAMDKLSQWFDIAVLNIR